LICAPQQITPKVIMTNITDAQGEPIWSNNDAWYKIVLADGNELGCGAAVGGGRYLVRPVPAGQGMVVRYQRYGGDNSAGQGWPDADMGFLRAMQIKDDGSQIIMNVALYSDPGQPFRLCLTNETVEWPKGFFAGQLSDNRVALYANRRTDELCGLRVASNGQWIVGNRANDWLVGLECKFVKVGSSRSRGNF
jgi:hypothetical protein